MPGLTPQQLAERTAREIETLASLIYEPKHISESAVPYDIRFPNDVPVDGGVYFLLAGRFIDYVGRSVSMHNRVFAHAMRGKIPFNRVWWIEVEEDKLRNALEAFYIRAFCPRYNLGRGCEGFIDLTPLFKRFPHWKTWHPEAHEK